MKLVCLSVILLTFIYGLFLDIIDLKSTITVTISSGKAVTIPNFYGKNKSTKNISPHKQLTFLRKQLLKNIDIR